MVQFPSTFTGVKNVAIPNKDGNANFRIAALSGGAPSLIPMLSPGAFPLSGAVSLMQLIIQSGKLLPKIAVYKQLVN
jgi:hypothetical protein